MTNTKTQASQPMFIEPMTERIDLNHFLTGGSDSCLLIQIEGYSLSDIPISNGDWVMIDRAKQPKQNDIVITDYNGEYTITYYQPDARRGLRLVTDEPEKPIDKYEIFGVVTFIIKSLEATNV